MTSSNKKNDTSIHCLPLDLMLIEEWTRIKQQVEHLDDRCLFIETIYGRNHRTYQDLHTQRDQLLIDSNRLLDEWIQERGRHTAAQA